MFMWELLETKPVCRENPFGTTHHFHNTTHANLSKTEIKEDHYLETAQCCWCGIEGKTPHGFKISYGVEAPNKARP